MSMTDTYKPFLNDWKPEYGKKPRLKEIKPAESLARQGSKTAFAIAMGLRAGGTTQSQIVKVLGLPHRNKIKQLAKAKKLKVMMEKGRPAVLHLAVK